MEIEVGKRFKATKTGCVFVVTRITVRADVERDLDYVTVHGTWEGFEGKELMFLETLMRSVRDEYLLPL